jgi:hypothetical protein
VVSPGPEIAWVTRQLGRWADWYYGTSRRLLRRLPNCRYVYLATALLLSTVPVMESELQTYKDQLAYVNLSLETDAGNQELLDLKTELVELITLTQSALGPAKSTFTSTSTGDKGKGKAKEGNSNWQDVGPYKAGMDCMAKYKDGKLWVRGRRG